MSRKYWRSTEDAQRSYADDGYEPVLIESPVFNMCKADVLGNLVAVQRVAIWVDAKGCAVSEEY